MYWLNACLRKLKATFSSKGAYLFSQAKSTKRDEVVISKGAAVGTINISELKSLIVSPTYSQLRDEARLNGVVQ